MNLSIIASLPVESDRIVASVDWIAHKKIAKVALNWIERLIDWIFSRLYSPYNEFYKNKKKRIHNLTNQIEIEGAKNASFYLFDRTQRALFAVKHDAEETNILFNGAPICFKGSNPFEEISDKKVYFILQEHPFSSIYVLTKKKEEELDLFWHLEEFKNANGELLYFGKPIDNTISATASTKWSTSSLVL